MPTGHNRWTIQGVLFDEIPLSPMLVYPSDWQNDAIWRLTLNDFGDCMVAAVSGNWILTAIAGSKSAQCFVDSSAASTDAACYVYQGYGFKLWAPTGPTYGTAQVLLDGVIVGTVNFHSASAIPSSALLTVLNVPLGLHTLMLQPLIANSILFDALQVMR